jgi:hypothetical protein
MGIAGITPPLVAELVHAEPMWMAKLGLCDLPIQPVSARLVLIPKLSDDISPVAEAKVRPESEVEAPAPVARSTRISAPALATRMAARIRSRRMVASLRMSLLKAKLPRCP